MEYSEKLARQLREVTYHGRSIDVELDAREGKGGEKVWNWIKKRIPIRLEIGPRDIAKDSVFVGRRDRDSKDRYGQSREEFITTLPQVLDEMQQGLLDRALAYRKEQTRSIDSKDEFYEYFTPQNAEKPEIHGGFAACHWSGEAEVEEKIKDDLNVTIRCIPLDAEPEEGKCILSGKPSKRRVIFGKAY